MVTSSDGTTKPPLSRTPWKGGSVPVRMVVCEGRVRGVWLMQFSKRMPPAARASMAGVRTEGLP